MLDDDRVLIGMDAGGEGRWLPTGIKIKDGRPAGDKLVSLAMLGRIAAQLEKLLLQMADGLYDGDIAARPLQHGGILRCNSCDYRPVCRHRDGENETEVPKGIWKRVLLASDEEEVTP